MPLSARMPSSRSLSPLRWLCGAAMASSVAIEGLLERGLAEPAEGVNEALILALALAEIEVDQPLDGVGDLVGDEAWAEDFADGSGLGAVAANGDLVELGALLLH